MKIFGILLGAGSSERFGSNKLKCQLRPETIAERSYRILQESNICNHIIYVSSDDNLMPNIEFVKGGATRFESMLNGVSHILKEVEESDYATTYILIHNAANPGLTSREISQCVEVATKVGACGVGHKLKDTIRHKCSDGFNTLDRNDIWAMQTPQCIRLDVLLQGIEYVSSYNQNNPDNLTSPTDDLQLLDWINYPYEVIEGSETNFKITTRKDLLKMRAVLNLGSRVGVGQDSHEFSNDGDLVIGGLTFLDYPKLKANSDGDVILHALFNALSSAIGGRSISHTADSMCENGIMDSHKYLDIVLERVSAHGYSIGNVSISLICDHPKIDSIEADLKSHISQILDISVDCIGITATTGEGGNSYKKGIQCTCMVTLI